MPGGTVDGCSLHHILDCRLVLVPTAAIAEILVGQFPALQRIGGVHLETARIERPAQPAHYAALACSIPAFQDDDGTMRRAEVRLLHALQGLLHYGQTALVVGELHRGEALNRSEVRSFADD